MGDVGEDILKRVPGTQKNSWVYVYKNQLYYADARPNKKQNTVGVYIRCKHKNVCPATIYLRNFDDVGRPVEVIGEHVNHDSYEHHLEIQEFRKSITQRAIDEWTDIKAIFDEESIKPQ